MRSIHLAWFAAVLAAAACSDRAPVAYGNANAVIVIAMDSVWETVGDRFHAALEPRIFAVRDERTFDVTHVSPAEPEWRTLRQWKQVIVIGKADDAWVSPALDRDALPNGTAPALAEKGDIWARGQLVTAVVLPPDAGPEAVIDVIPELHRRLDSRFRQYTLERMFASGPNTALRDSLRARAGFGLLVPQVYDVTWGERAIRFLNDQAVSPQIIRSIVVTWRPGADSSLDAEKLFAWRDSVVAEHYTEPQVTNRDRIESRTLDAYPAGSFEVVGIWSSPPGQFPAAGPFIGRVIVCPEQDRTYFIDAWLYAPAKGKYEYMLQFETILDTFECAGSPASAE